MGGFVFVVLGVSRWCFVFFCFLVFVFLLLSFLGFLGFLLIFRFLGFASVFVVFVVQAGTFACPGQGRQGAIPKARFPSQGAIFGV